VNGALSILNTPARRLNSHFRYCRFMGPRAAATLWKWLLPNALLVAGIALAATPATTSSPVTATPPLQAVPATPVSKNVQQRMRACNATADGKKLQAAARETFIKSCMTAHHSHPASRSGSQPKPNP
jgi:psiF repeat